MYFRQEYDELGLCFVRTRFLHLQIISFPIGQKSGIFPFVMATIVLGITGSIAACKAADIASRLVKLGHSVHCVCTKAALDFVTPITLQTLSRNKAYCQGADDTENWAPSHIELAQKADLFLVAPLTANTLAQFALGLAPDMLSSLYLATRAKVALCPAMNGAMWDHPAVQQHIPTLLSRPNHYIWGPDSQGVLACGDEGKGRLLPVDEIVDRVQELLAQSEK